MKIKNEDNHRTSKMNRNGSRSESFRPFWQIPYKKSDRDLFFRALFYNTIAILIVEIIVMVLLVAVLHVSQTMVIIIDGIILVAVLFPLNYFFLILPLQSEVEDHLKTDRNLMITQEVIDGFFNISYLAFAYLDPKFNFVRVNEAFAKFNNDSPQYFVGKNLFDLFSVGNYKEILETVMKTHQPFRVKELAIVRNGHAELGTTYQDLDLVPTVDSKGNSYGLIMAFLDSTKRVEIRLDLEESENRFRGAFDQAYSQMIFFSLDGQVLLINDSALDFSLLSRGDLIGKYFWELPWWEQSRLTSETLHDLFQKALAGVLVATDFPIFSKTGHQHVVKFALSLLRDENGNAIYIFYEAIDITERIENEKQLKYNMETIQSLNESETNALQESEILRNAALALSSQLSKESVLETLLDLLQQLVPFTSAHLYLAENEHHLLVRIARGDDAWEEKNKIQGKLITVDEEPLFKRLLTEKTVMQVPDTSVNYGRSSFFPGKKFIGSWVGFPLMAGEHVVGLCVLEHRDVNFFTPKMVELITTLTNQAGVAIQNALMFEQAQTNRLQIQALARHIVKVQEEERKYIARELHDEAGQSIASLKMGLTVLQRYSQNPDEIVQRSEELKGIADGVLEILHNLAVFLRPPLLDHLGLIPAIHQFAENVCSQNGLSLQFNVKENFQDISQDSETAIYRIIQEALTNIIRHAHAKNLLIELARNNGNFEFIIEDDGVGFDPDVPHFDRLGLVGMNERALMLGGKIRFENRTIGGMRVVLEVPCQSAS